MGTHPLIACLISVATMCGISRAGELVFPLPQFLGSYSLDSLDETVWREVYLETGLYSYHVSSARIVLKGTITPGLIRGDGVTVPAQDVELKGWFHNSLATGGRAFYSISPPADGTFELEWTYSPLYPVVTPMPGSGESSALSPHIAVGLSAASLAMDLPPRLDEWVPGSLRWWFDGYSIVRPMTGEITEAYLVAVPTVPEPGSLGAVGVAVTLGLCRRRARAQ